MRILQKIEMIINRFLLQLAAALKQWFWKFTPAKLSTKLSHFKMWLTNFKANCRALPPKILPWLIEKIGVLKAWLLTYDFKAKLKETYHVALGQYLQDHPGKISKFKSTFLAPVLVMSQWLKGLSTGQTLLLLGFSSASFLAAVNMVFSGQRLMDKATDHLRSPASVATVEDEFSRPDYYKKHRRYLELVNFRLPVYYADVNELKSIDIDFTATLSNRLSSKILDKLQFQLRDHLILNFELMVASFPLEEEGKEILRAKLFEEIKAFIKSKNVEGEVLEVKITYVLAN
jgi:flagellar basal body-associated protein FliL